MVFSNAYYKKLKDLSKILNEKNIVFAPAGLETFRLMRDLKFFQISPNFIYDDNPALKGKSYDGVPIVNDRFSGIFINTFFVIASTTFMQKMQKSFIEKGVPEKNIHCDYQLLLYQYLEIDKIESVELLLRKEQKKISYSYNLMKDNQSRKSFLRRIDYLRNPCIDTLITKNIKNKHDFFCYEENEVLLDGGAFNGEFMLDFIEKVDGKFGNYHAIEPNQENFNLLKTQSIDKRINYYNIGLSSSRMYHEIDSGLLQTSIYTSNQNQSRMSILFNSIDNLFSNEYITTIKLNVNGYEKQSLFGGVNLIKKHNPKLMISCYYHVMDFIEIPILINKFFPNYEIFLRDCSDTIYDTVCFAKPRE